MRITIAMTSYNGSEFIIEQLDSILAQTRQPDELIISDDGSSDDEAKWQKYPKIVSEYDSRYDFYSKTEYRLNTD